MSPFFRKRFLLHLAVLVCLSWMRKADAQARYQPRFIEPNWFTFHLSEASAGVYSEGTFDSTRYTTSGQKVSHQYIFVGPSVGIIADGSIFHPNLLRYSINVDGAYGYGYDRLTSTTTQERNDWDWLGNFAGSLDFLSSKPYNGSIYANYDHTFRDNDFFTQVTVDSWRYGARAGWSSDNWSVAARYEHRDEEATSPYSYYQPIPGGPTQVVYGTLTVTHEDTLSVSARNERERGGTSLNYMFDQYTRSDGPVLGEGTDHTVSLSDGERFGSRDQFRLNSSLSYTLRDTTEESSQDLLGNVNFGAEHTDRLASYYDLNYEHFTAEDFTSDTYSGSAIVTHQLYDSLTSSATVRASSVDSSADDLEGYTRRIGGGFSEAYTKQIGQDHKLRLSNSLFVDHTDQQALSIVENERHTLGEPGSVTDDSFYLSRTHVIESTIVLTDTRSVQQFIQGLDYQVFLDGSRTRIRWLSGVPKPAAILASYRTEPTPAGTYNTLSESFNIRMELWKNLIGVYGRINLSVNDAPSDLHVLDFTSYAVGMDATWRWLRAGAEYEIYNSSESDYKVARLFQSFVFHPDEVSTLSFDFNETWIDYTDLNRPREEDYRFITRYHRALTHRLGVDLEGGVALRRGTGVDEVLATVRPSLRYVIGKTSISAGYSYEYNLFLDTEEREKHLFYLRVRRTF
jgi:hypothetical protein